MFGWDDVFGVSVRKGDFCVFIYILNDKIVDFLICNGFLSKDCRKFQLNFRIINIKFFKGYLFDKISIRLVIEQGVDYEFVIWVIFMMKLYWNNKGV